MDKTVIRAGLVIAICLISVAPGPAYCATTVHTGYTIKRVWSDSTNVFIYYTKDVVTVHYSLTDWEGTVTGEEHTHFMKTFSKSSTGTTGSFSLEGGEPAGSILYKDSNFNVLRTSNGIVLSGQSSTTIVQGCDNSIWSSGWPISVRGQLFSCGFLLDSSGKELWQVPKSAINVIAQKEERWNPARKPFFRGFPKKLIYFLSKGRLIAAWVDPGADITEVEFAVLPITKGQEVSWHKVQLPQSVKGSDIQNYYRAYSPSGGLVIRHSLPKGQPTDNMFLCDDASCRPINVPKGCEYYEYVLIDSDNKEVCFFFRDNVATPILNMFRTHY